jgi:hypothetical protein
MERLRRYGDRLFKDRTEKNSQVYVIFLPHCWSKRELFNTVFLWFAIKERDERNIETRASISVTIK